MRGIETQRSPEPWVGRGQRDQKGRGEAGAGRGGSEGPAPAGGAHLLPAASQSVDVSPREPQQPGRPPQLAVVARRHGCFREGSVGWAGALPAARGFATPSPHPLHLPSAQGVNRCCRLDPRTQGDPLGGIDRRSYQKQGHHEATLQGGDRARQKAVVWSHSALKASRKIRGRTVLHPLVPEDSQRLPVGPPHPAGQTCNRQNPRGRPRQTAMKPPACPFPSTVRVSQADIWTRRQEAGVHGTPEQQGW